MIRAKYVTDSRGIMHKVEYCSHCNNQIEQVRYFSGEYNEVYCSTRCALESLKIHISESENKPKKIREIRMVHL